MANVLNPSQDGMTPAKLSEAVIVAIAEKEGVDEQELDSPLFEVINPDALDSLFRNSGGRVQFEYLDYQVTVNHNGVVDVAEARDI